LPPPAWRTGTTGASGRALGAGVAMIGVSQRMIDYIDIAVKLLTDNSQDHEEEKLWY
jgi:hypothetical protein